MLIVNIEKNALAIYGGQKTSSKFKIYNNSRLSFKWYVQLVYDLIRMWICYRPLRKQKRLLTTDHKFLYIFQFSFHFNDIISFDQSLTLSVS